MSWNNVKSSVQNSIKQNGSGAITGNLLQGVLLTICNEAELGIGPQGKSAYQVWLDEGNVGTVSDFFGSLKGETGDNVCLRKTTTGIEWKLSSQPDTDYQLLVTIDELKLHFSDLSAADIAVLQKPATDVADALTIYVQQKDQALTQLQQDTESARQDAITATTNAEQATTAATSAANAANQATTDANNAKTTADQATVAADQATINANSAKDAANVAAGLANSAADAANQATIDATAATQSATTAVTKAEELNANQPKIVNGEWWVYDLVAHAYINTGLPARGPQGKGPIVLANGNYGNWDETSQTYLDTGIIAAATINLEDFPVSFTEAATRENIQTGETVPTVFGKLKKWFSDLGALAWKTKVDYQNDIDNLPSIPAAQIQPDWNQTNTAQADYIKNRPAFKTVFGQLLTGVGDITPKLVNDVSFQSLTGDLTFSFSDGSEHKVINIPVDNFLNDVTYNITTHILTFQMSDGSINQINLEDLVDEYKAAAGGGLELVNNNEFKIADEVLTVINRTPLHKSVVLSTSAWIEGGTLWSYTVSDTDIVDGCLVDFAPDNDTYTVYTDAGIRPFADASVGSITLYAENKPDDNINLLYSIIR